MNINQDLNESDSIIDNITDIKTQKSRTARKNRRLFIYTLSIILIILFVIGGAVYLYSYTVNIYKIPNPQTVETDKTTETNEPSTQINPQIQNIRIVNTSENTSDWQVYENTDYGFSIKYPVTINSIYGEWIYDEYSHVDGTVLVGFGPLPSFNTGEYAWGVTVYKNKTVDEIIESIGHQFEDIEKSTEMLKINGQYAVLVTATTSQIPDWVSETVIIEHEDTVYAIGNGAVQDSNFEDFYSSFEIL